MHGTHSEACVYGKSGNRGNLVIDTCLLAVRARTAAKPVVRHHDAQKPAIPVSADASGSAQRASGNAECCGALKEGGIGISAGGIRWK